MSQANQNHTNSTDGLLNSLNPWDFWMERDDSLPSKIVDYIIFCITIPALVIYTPTCFIICREQQFWKLSAFHLLLAQNVYEMCNLVIRCLPLLIHISPTGVGCVILNDIIEIFWYLSLYSHLMIAGNRFVAVVLYNRYVSLFTSKFTAAYIFAFFLLPVVQRECFTVAGIKGCILDRGGLLLRSTTGELMGAYALTDVVVTATIVALLIASYIIILYKLRQVMSVRKKGNVVKPSEPGGTGTAGQPGKVVVVGEGVSQEAGASSVVTNISDAATADNNKGKRRKKVVNKSTKSTSGKGGNTMGSQEIKLTLHFVLVTAVYLLTYLFWLISYFLAVPHAFDIFFLLSILNFSSSAFSIVMLNREVRGYLIKYFTCNTLNN